MPEPLTTHKWDNPMWASDVECGYSIVVDVAKPKIDRLVETWDVIARIRKLQEENQKLQEDLSWWMNLFTDQDKARAEKEIKTLQERVRELEEKP